MKKLIPLLLVLALALSACNANVKVSHGDYKDGRYTSKTANFSCNFGAVLEGDSPFTLEDGEDQNGAYGAMSLLFDFGTRETVDYIRISALLPENQALFANPQTRPDALRVMANLLIQSLALQGPAPTVLEDYYMSERAMHVLVLDVPQGSFQSVQETNTRLDASVAYYIFADNEWVYYVGYMMSDSPLFPSADVNVPALLQGVEKLFNKCSFDL